MLGTTREQQRDALECKLRAWTSDHSWRVTIDETTAWNFVAMNDDGRTLFGYRTYEDTFVEWRNEFFHRKFGPR